MGTEPLTVEAIRAAHAEVTPGPYRWFGNVDTQTLYLSTIDRGRLLIMDFVRWGLQRAQPRFPVQHRMRKSSDELLVRAAETPVFEVARSATSRDDPRVYRGDVVDIDEPHARYLSRSWERIEFLLCALETAERQRDEATRQRDAALGELARIELDKVATAEQCVVVAALHTIGGNDHG